MKKNICAVVVTFNPEFISFNNFVSNICNQVDKLIIVDNGSNNTEFLMEKYGNKSANIECIRNNENFGLSYAQNQGLNEAIKNNYEYVILFDQDSTPHDNLISSLYNAYKELELNNCVAAVGPRFIDPRNNVVFPFIKYGNITNKKIEYNPESKNKYNNVDFLISSGCMMSVSHLKNIGLMDESLFIDLIDTEWCLRAKSKKYLLFGIDSAFMTHSIGDKPIEVWLGRDRNILVHSPLRKYYMTRNRVLLMRRSYIPLRWKVASLIRMIISSLIYPIFVPKNKSDSVRYIIKGYVDGLRGKANNFTQ